MEGAWVLIVTGLAFAAYALPARRAQGQDWPVRPPFIYPVVRRLPLRAAQAYNGALAALIVGVGIAGLFLD